MKILVKYIYALLSLFFIYYLLLPNPDFPKQIPSSIQSFEPADSETSLRRGYYMDFSREEIINYYHSNLKLHFLGLSIPRYRLNYPPEEAQQLIRDQARSTYLEEIVHPLRDSFFINGFEPNQDKDMIFIEGRRWYQKVIIKYVPSMVFARVVVGLMIIIVIPFIFILYRKTLAENMKKDIIASCRRYYGF